MTKILNKPMMYDLYERGEFGNKWPCWKTIKEWYDSGYKENINFRYRGNSTGKFVVYDIKPEDGVKEYCKLLLDGIQPSEIHITGGDMGLDRLLNGEIGCINRTYFLLYSTVNKVMREALKEESYETSGQNCLEIIRRYMDDKSYINTKQLLHTFPEHVIEFTCYKKPVGLLNWNTVFWEVRYY